MCDLGTVMGEVRADAQGCTRCWWTRTGKVYTPFSPDRFVRL